MSKKHDWWASSFAFAVIELGLSPSDFWRLTLPEMQMLIQELPNSTSNAPSKAQLSSMLEQFPDR